MQLSYVARQPVFDGALERVGYELFFRAGPTESAGTFDPSAATTSVLGSLVVDWGFEALVDGRRAFVNVPARFLEEGHHRATPPDRLVFELSVGRDIPFLAASVAAARDDGYTIALDGFTPGDRAHGHLLDHVDMVKVDVNGDTARARAAAEVLADRPVTAVAQKVETGEHLELCRELGFDLFQGHFFARPDVMARPSMSPGRVAAARLLVELHRPEADAHDVADVIRRDVGLTYRLLTLVNSSFYGLRNRVESVPQAVTLLGLGTVTRHASVLALLGLHGGSSEVVAMAMVRARMCELAAQRTIRAEAPAAFTLGLLSLLDAVLGMPVEDIVERLPMSERIRDALLRREGPLGDLLHQVEDYERDGAPSGVTTSRIPAPVLASAYVDAVAWADDLRGALDGPRRTWASPAGTAFRAR